MQTIPIPWRWGWLYCVRRQEGSLWLHNWSDRSRSKLDCVAKVGRGLHRPSSRSIIIEYQRKLLSHFSTGVDSARVTSAVMFSWCIMVPSWPLSATPCSCTWSSLASRSATWALVTKTDGHQSYISRPSCTFLCAKGGTYFKVSSWSRRWLANATICSLAPITSSRVCPLADRSVVNPNIQPETNCGLWLVFVCGWSCRHKTNRPTNQRAAKLIRSMELTVNSVRTVRIVSWWTFLWRKCWPKQGRILRTTDGWRWTLMLPDVLL